MRRRGEGGFKAWDGGRSQWKLLQHTGIPNLWDQMMEGGEMALLAAPTFSDVRMFCDVNFRGTESTAFSFRNCVLSLFQRKENVWCWWLSVKDKLPQGLYRIWWVGKVSPFSRRLNSLTSIACIPWHDAEWLEMASWYRVTKLHPWIGQREELWQNTVCYI